MKVHRFGQILFGLTILLAVNTGVRAANLYFADEPQKGAVPSPSDIQPSDVPPPPAADAATADIVGECCGDARLFGLIAPSDTCFCDFISPMTNPVFFEDPRTLTEARIIFLHHQIPDRFGGDTIRLLAMQVRAALTDRLSIVAAKDGFIMTDSPLLRDGWADVSVGLKYNLFVDPCCRKLLSVGASYDMPIGSTRALQGNGDGEFHVYTTGLAEIAPNVHWISGTGFRLPSNTTEESQSWYWSNHLDKRICDSIYLFGEVNWYHWLRSGNNAGTAGFEGGDLFNLGSRGVAGNDIVTGAIGVKYKPHCGLELGVAWEAPLTEREDLLDNRLTVDLILRY